MGAAPRSWRAVSTLALALALTMAAAGCNKASDTFLLITVEEQPGLRAAIAPEMLRVNVKDAAQGLATHTFTRSGSPTDLGSRPPLVPTTFSLQLPRNVAGPLWLEVVSLALDGTVLARSVTDRLAISSGQRQSVRVVLECQVSCVTTGGADAGGSVDAGGGDAALTPDARSSTCGNGQVDEGELCDPAIPAGRWGACPPADCNDGLACTIDTPTGSGCRASCQHTQRPAKAGDACCPAGATFATDSDCSATCGNGKVEAATSADSAAERCDLGIAPGGSGACPTEAGCDDRDPCTSDSVLSAGTCSASCVNRPVLDTSASDGCCAPGSSSGSDPDCPAVCGNGRRDKGEACDRGAPAGSSEACPTSCEDNDPCTRDLLTGAACQTVCANQPITEALPGDRCCPPGATRDLDSDCPAICGNKVVEPGETCDKAIAAPAVGACPESCSATLPACFTRRLEGRQDDCTARCTEELAPALCSAQGDGCCPAGCSYPTDPDCSPSCGNGIVDARETCDTTIAPGSAGACPVSCNDGQSCTSDMLVSKGTCSARCEYLPVTTPHAGDGCCPPGANAALDSDCASQCGDGVVAGGKETCDKAIAAGQPGACPTTCPTQPAGCMRTVLAGEPATCTSRCQIETVKVCVGGDSCCPAGCNAVEDRDCSPVCGNTILEPGEACDRSISTGLEGACPSTCEDNKSCTRDSTLGRVSDCSRTCRNEVITACRSGDGCCPLGCLPLVDSDCSPVCGNGILESLETCDPPIRCPSICPDDKDPCTRDRLLGDASRCTAACIYVPIVSCSSNPDKCCPSTCTAATDVDCLGTPTLPPPR